LLVESNNTKRDYPEDSCIHQLFEAQVERTPDVVAVTYADRQLTYQDLNRRANWLAHHLQKLGVGPEALVGLYVERSLEVVVGLLGVLKAGGAYVPLDPAYPQERLTFMLRDAQVGVLLTQELLAKRLPECEARIVCLDSDWEGPAWESEANPGSNVSADNLAYVIYTSGSTGKPKGVMIPHTAAVNTLCWLQETFRLTPSDVVAQKNLDQFYRLSMGVFLAPPARSPAHYYR
jgi:non-ribosomal peptide synthetase component F